MDEAKDLSSLVCPLFVLSFKLYVALASSIGSERLLWYRIAVHTTAPLGLGTSESGW